jgi:hypothetical protein
LSLAQTETIIEVDVAVDGLEPDYTLQNLLYLLRFELRLLKVSLEMPVEFFIKLLKRCSIFYMKLYLFLFVYYANCYLIDIAHFRWFGEIFKIIFEKSAVQTLRGAQVGLKMLGRIREVSRSHSYFDYYLL